MVEPLVWTRRDPTSATVPRDSPKPPTSQSAKVETFLCRLWSSEFCLEKEFKSLILMKFFINCFQNFLNLGWIWFKNGLFVDLNECAMDNDCNSTTSVCVNEVGSYKCICKQGYSLQASDCMSFDFSIYDLSLNNIELSILFSNRLAKICVVCFQKYWFSD